MYKLDCGFFFTPMIFKWNVACNSGCVTCAFLKRIPVGRTKRSNFGGFRTNPSPTKVAFVIIRFHAFFFRLPVLMTLNISASEILGTYEQPGVADSVVSLK